MPKSVSSTRYSLVKGERIVRSELSTRLHVKVFRVENLYYRRDVLLANPMVYVCCVKAPAEPFDSALEIRKDVHRNASSPPSLLFGSFRCS